MKTVAQFSALRRGALDLTLYPLAYAGGEVPEVNVGLMPCLVTSYAQGLAWKTAPIGQELQAVLDRRGVKILTWIWQGGGVASRAGAVVKPDDTKGLKIRGASREMDLMLKASGGIISSVTSDETYAAMLTGSLDAAVTSSTSLISFRLQEIAKNVTTARGGSFWFMLEPLLISKQIFDSLTPEQQAAVTEVGAAQEPFALEAAKADDPGHGGDLRQGGGEGVRHDCGRHREVEGGGAGFRVEGLCRAQRRLREHAETGRGGCLSAAIDTRDIPRAGVLAPLQAVVTGLNTVLAGLSALAIAGGRVRADVGSDRAVFPRHRERLAG